MTEPEPAPPAGGWDVGTFILAVAVPLLSAGLLINDIMVRYCAGLFPLGDVMSNHFIRLAGPVMPVLGGLTCFYLAFSGTSTRVDRRFYRGFLAVNVGTLVAWTAYLMYG